jgi:hypothetical protein
MNNAPNIDEESFLEWLLCHDLEKNFFDSTLGKYLVFERFYNESIILDRFFKFDLGNNSYYMILTFFKPSLFIPLKKLEWIQTFLLFASQRFNESKAYPMTGWDILYLFEKCLSD